MPHPVDYVSQPPAIFGLIPKASKAELRPGEFHFSGSLRVSAELWKRLSSVLTTFGVETLSDDDAPQILLKETPDLGTEAFRISIEPECITLEYGDQSAKCYVMGAMEQLLYLAFRYGADQAFLECGVVEDRPRFAWRGAMLDCARHFQSVGTVLRLLKAMARLRLNRFHWHLTDCQGWRLPSQGAPLLNTLGALQAGAYTPEDIALVRKSAAEYGIQIIPEVDFPGHSNGVLSLYPELRCLPDSYGNEICLGGDATWKFVKARLDEVMALFPESRYIHVGGDEAWDGWWRQCKKCQAKMKELGLENARKLEEWFMRRISQYLVDHGRTPLSWRTDAILTPENVLQCWGSANDMYACAYHDQGKNLVVSSIDNAYYMDYPQNFQEPRFQWMVLLTEEAVYSANPAAHMGEALGDRLLGVDCPLWTEIIPEWRVGAKFFPRLVAAADSVWCTREKDFAEYHARRLALEDAGYLWW